MASRSISGRSGRPGSGRPNASRPGNGRPLASARGPRHARPSSRNSTGSITGKLPPNVDSQLIEEELGEVVKKKVEVRRKPDDQIQGLTEEQLDEVIVKVTAHHMLCFQTCTNFFCKQVTTASDPKLVKPTSHFDYHEGTYRVDTAMDHLAVHFEMQGWLGYPEVNM